jgi:PAS domain S-box-containing protein
MGRGARRADQEEMPAADTTPSDPIAVLLVEDSARYQPVVEDALARGGIQARVRRTEDEAGLRAALDEEAWDAVLCDHHLPGFGSAEALEIARAHDETLPFILVSGTADEERIVAAMQNGAWNFVSKEQLSRLPPVLTRAIDDAAARKQHRDDQRRLAQLASIVESSQNAIVATDLTGLVTSWNRGAEQLYGFSAEEAIGMSLYRIVPSEKVAEQQELLEKAARGDTVASLETKRLAKDGTTREVALTVSPIYEHGEVVGASSIGRDVADRKRAEAALRRSEGAYRTLVENLPDALVLMFDTNRRIVLAAGPLLEKSGWSADAMRGRTVSELIPADRAEFYERIYEGALQGISDSVETTSYRNPDLTICLDVVPVYGDDGEIAGGMVLGRDVTEQRRSEDQLRATRELFEGAFENAPVGMAIVGADPSTFGQFIRANDAFAEMLGVAPADLVGSPPSDVTHPEDLPGQIPRLERMLRGELDEHHSHKRYVRRDGSVAWGMLRARLVRNADGSPRYALGVIADITSRIEAEREQERLEKMLNQAQKLEGIGRLAGGIAHDFNNLLAVILNYAEIGRDEQLADEAFTEISRAANRAADLTSRLLVFSRQEVVQPVVFELNTLVEELQNFLERTLGEDVELSTVLASSGPRVQCDKVQLEQALINLAINARDAMEGGGRLSIETDAIEVGADQARGMPGLAPGPHAEIRVVDSGTGMTPDVLERVFEPFYTTKERGQGTGLGLAMIYGIVTRAGGAVLIDSEPGEGTTVRLLLPRVDAAARVDAEVASADLPAGSGRRVLVVEDEDAVRKLIDRILSGHGYDVVSASRPDHALELAQDGKFDILLTDVVMPGMSGPELARELSAHHPDMAVLFMTGYTERPAQIPPDARVVHKPFRAEDLLRDVGSS